MKKKSLLKPLIITGIALCLLLAGGIVALYTLVPPEKVAAIMLPQAEKAMGRRITIEKAGFSFFPLGLSLSGLSVENTGREGFSRLPFLTVDKLTACVSMGSLFRGSPEVTQLVLKKPVLRIEVSKEGTMSFDDLRPRDSSLRRQLPPLIPVLPLPLTLERLIVEGGTLGYDNRQNGIQARIGTIDQNARFAIDPGSRSIATDGTLTLSDIAVKAGGFVVPLTGIVVTVTHDIGANLPEGTVTINRITASCGKVAATVTGTVREVMTTAPMLDLTLSAPTMNAQDIISLLPEGTFAFAPKLVATGTFTTGARLEGRMLPGRPPLLAGSAKLSGVTLKDALLSGSINNLNAAVDFTDKSIVLDSLSMLVGTSPVEIRAVVTDLKKRLFDAKIKANLDLDEVKDIVHLPAGSAVGGKVAADIALDGVIDPADPGKLYCTGQVDFSNATLLRPPLAHPAALSGRITFAKEGARARLSLALEGSSLDADATVTHYLWLVAPKGAINAKRPVIDCKLTSPLLDLDKLLLVCTSPKPGTGNASSGGAPSASPDLLFAPPLPFADLHATLSAKRIVYKGFVMNDAESKMASVNNVADVKFASAFSTGTVDNAFHADLGKPGSISFADKFAVKNVQLGDFLARFGDLVPQTTPLTRQLGQLDKSLYGRIGIQGDLRGAGATPDRIASSLTGGMAIRMADGKLENTPFQKTASAAIGAFLKSDKLEGINPITFKELNAAVRIANGRAFIDELKILSDLGDWKARGSVGFDAALDLAVATRLSKAMSGKLLAVEGAAKGAAKNLLAGTQLAGASSLLDNLSLIPHDHEGRISLKFALSGPADNPRVGNLDFGDVGQGRPAVGKGGTENDDKGKQGSQEEMIKKAGEQIKNTLRGLFQ